MALQDMTPADLAAVMNNDDGGWDNGNGWWIILLFLFLGWGNNGWGGGGNRGAGDAGGDILYPWLNSAETVMNGFNGVQQALCNGFAGTTAAVTNGFANAETAATARQMANMQQMFDLSQQFANCCCENRLGLANLGADIAREACADRAAVSDGVRDILANQTASVQRILDQISFLPSYLWIPVEEWSAQVLEGYSMEAIALASECLGRPLCIKGQCSNDMA